MSEICNLPTSVPWNEKPADKRTLIVPTAPLLKAPGSFQYLNTEQKCQIDCFPHIRTMSLYLKPMVPAEPTAPVVVRIAKKIEEQDEFLKTDVISFL